PRNSIAGSCWLAMTSARQHPLSLRVPGETPVPSTRAVLVELGFVPLQARNAPGLERRRDRRSVGNDAGAGEDNIEDLLAVGRVLQGVTERLVVAGGHRQV